MSKTASAVKRTAILKQCTEEQARHFCVQVQSRAGGSIPSFQSIAAALEKLGRQQGVDNLMAVVRLSTMIHKGSPDISVGEQRTVRHRQIAIAESATLRTDRTPGKTRTKTKTPPKRLPKKRPAAHTTSPIKLASKRCRWVDNSQNRCCDECHTRGEKKLWRYSRSNQGTICLCSRCKRIVLDRSFGPIDAQDVALEGGAFETNPRRH
jgi:hypothetical protein